MSEVGDKPRCVLFTKSDLEQKWKKGKIETFLRGDKPISLSAKTGIGLEDLKEAIYNHVLIGKRTEESITITRERHRDHLQQAAEALGIASGSMVSGCSEELVAVDVTLAMEHLGSVLGKTFAEDLLDKIFGQFCIGK
jgi:tRNA modification GTPase